MRSIEITFHVLVWLWTPHTSENSKVRFKFDKHVAEKGTTCETSGTPLTEKPMKRQQVKTSQNQLNLFETPWVSKIRTNISVKLQKTSNNPSCLTLKLFILSPKPAIPGQGACTTSEGEWLGPKIYQGLGWARAGFGSNITEHIISINIYI